jgi:hypothetical protein
MKVGKVEAMRLSKFVNEKIICQQLTQRKCFILNIMFKIGKA